MIRISVHGRATHSHRPMRAQVRLAVSLEGRDRAAVLAESTSVHNQVAEQARAQVDSGAATWWGAEQVHSHAFKEYVKDSDTTVTKFRAASQVLVRFQDFEALAAWVAAVSERRGVNVQGISWELTQQARREAEAKARAAALSDAVARASDYASAIGAGAPELEGVFEDGLRPNVTGGGGGGPVPMAIRGAAAPGSGAGGLALEPGDVDVTAVISADFLLPGRAPAQGH